jgi:hypothetical protein
LDTQFTRFVTPRWLSFWYVAGLLLVVWFSGEWAIEAIRAKAFSQLPMVALGLLGGLTGVRLACEMSMLPWRIYDEIRTIRRTVGDNV